MSRTVIPILSGFESTYLPDHDADVTETTGHHARWAEDLDLVVASGVRGLRYPVRWHRIEEEPGRLDWRHTDQVLGRLHDTGVEVIADLLHHTSYPRWVGGFGEPGFGEAYLRFVEAVARRYRWLDAYTVFNEPFTTYLMCGEAGLWPPHRTGLEGFVELATNSFGAIVDASRMLCDLLPDAQHFHVEVCERHTGEGDAGERYAEYANDRRFVLTDVLVGRRLDDTRPFVRALVEAGGEALLELPPGHVDVLGLDYYAHNQWHWYGEERGTRRPPAPPPLAELIVEYSDRYGLPCALGETNIRGTDTDRATWFKHTLEQCEAATAAGVPVVGYCWYPFVDSADWGSLLRECEGAIDPVGVYSLDDDLSRRPSAMSRSWKLAAAGTPAAELPAYPFSPPVAADLAGWLAHMAHWEWERAA